MFENFNQPVINLGKQFADSALKAQQLALNNFEQVANLQLKALETRVNATFEFLGEAAEVRDFDGVKAIWPKGFALVKESGEQLFATSQEAMGHTVKTSEAISQLIKTQVETANDSIVKPATKAKAAK
ncbi:phasin family protein [Pseudomarimonas arenosa]|uniref:Phasin family protein n=1 Tax=Pseudomarimonas arenosa TaxID=2774145 RepID=A0AAW3ZGC3_9GAMM|nr:phasin family protein [Pseudomarimonas arenosa]MBD8525180.1 phasin family protein [Pseudomarimonas arenosa]